MFEIPKSGIGCVVPTINTAAELGFLVFLPIFREPARATAHLRRHGRDLAAQ